MLRSRFAAAFAVLALAGCGGSSSDDAAPEGASGGNVRLVVYSTPREAYAKLIDLYKSGAGEGVSFDQSYGSSGEQSRAVEAGLQADVVAFSLEPDMTRLVDVGLVPTDWNAGEHKGMVTDSVVVFMVREGNPKGIKTLGRPDEGGRRGDHPEPVHLRRRALERDGRLRRPARAGQVGGAGARVSPQAVRERHRPGQERARVADDVRRRQGRRPARVRERGDLRPAPGAAVRLRRARPDDPDRESGRGAEGRLRGRQGLRRLPAHGRGAEGLRRRGLPARLEGRPRHVRLPDARRRSSRSPTSAAGRRSRTEFFDRENGFMAEVQRELGQPTDG